MRFVIDGLGNRGMVYGTWVYENGHEIAAIADLRSDRLQSAGDKFGIPADRRFSSFEEMLSSGVSADTAIIATQDKQHFAHAIAAMEQGYDLLLEKPISPDPKECLEIEKKALEKGRRVTVCHVLRYSPFFAKIKEIIDSGELGKIVSVKHAENIGNYHMAHSFVRGNWAVSKESGPIILTKSCHDMDLLLWLVGSHCQRVSAFGSNSFFKEENAPAGSAERCCDCSVAASCRYEAGKVYLPILGRWPADVVTLSTTEEGLMETLRESPYGRCVFRCGNDVCDHMSAILEFENGVTATFSLSAQTNHMHRTIHIMCEHGEILAEGETSEITVCHFGSGQHFTHETRTIHVGGVGDGHNGGDGAMMKDLTSMKASDCSSVSHSVESHLVACAMEKARVEHCVVDMDQYRRELS